MTSLNYQNLKTKSKAELLQIAEALEALSQKQKYNRLDFVFPETGPYRRELYPAHMRYMAAGKSHRFRAFIGANRSGKSFTGGTELSIHVTGRYPDYWEGRILKNPKTIWIIAESGALWRDSLQRILLGAAGEEYGTGLIPKECLSDKHIYAMPGVPGAVGSFMVKHKKGHLVSVVVKTYEMAREQFQAAKVDLILFDEEPPEHIYTECLMRLMGAGKEPGIAMLLFTPLKGLSEVCLKFLPGGLMPTNGISPTNPENFVCRIEWQDVPHLSEEDKAAMLLEIPSNERDARSKGIPALGSGKIYPVMESDIVVTPFPLPEHFQRAYGLDFGWNVTAAIWVAVDPATKTWYLYSEYYKGKVPLANHATAIKAKGAWIEGIADPSGGGRNGDGILIIDQYRDMGLSLHAGENAIHAGIAKVLNMLESGQLKVFSTCSKWLEEFRTYRYDKNDPNKPARNQADHLMDATRYLIMSGEGVLSTLPDEERDSVPYQRNDTGRSGVCGY